MSIKYSNISRIGLSALIALFSCYLIVSDVSTRPSFDDLKTYSGSIVRFISVGNSMYQRAVVRVEGVHCRLAGEHIAHSNVFFPIPKNGTKVVLLSRNFIPSGSDCGEHEFEVADFYLSLPIAPLLQHSYRGGFTPFRSSFPADMATPTVRPFRKDT